MRTILIVLIGFYQKAVSRRLPATCRYVPSCSDYAIECLKKYGVAKGSLKAVYRILRCNPFSRGGCDPA